MLISLTRKKKVAEAIDKEQEVLFDVLELRRYVGELNIEIVH